MANLAMFKETDGNYANESQPFEYVMAAAAQVMRPVEYCTGPDTNGLA